MNAVGSAEVDSSQVQLRISGSCASGSSIQAVNEDGTVTCEVDTINTNASNINTGTLSTDRFSGYDDLVAEGRLDNSSSDDLLTRVQADARYLFGGCIRRASPITALDDFYTFVEMTCQPGETPISGGWTLSSWNSTKMCIPVVSDITSASDGWRVRWAAPSASECAGNSTQTVVLCCTF